MTHLELNNFFKDIEFMPSYDIEKIIYSETINLDKYLFCSFNKRFNNYCLDWLKEKRANQTEYDLPRVEACIPYNYNPESNKLALIAENEKNNYIVINHYSFCENQIEFELDNFRLNGCYSIWYNYLYSEVYRFQKIMHDLFKKIQPQQNEIVKTDEKYKTENLFKVGLLFANGEMNKYFTINSLNEIVLNEGLSPLKVATALKNPSFEKYILASKNNYKKGENKSKNIFINLDMMTKIINHCKAEKKEVDRYFMSRLPIE